MGFKMVRVLVRVEGKRSNIQVIESKGTTEGPTACTPNRTVKVKQEVCFQLLATKELPMALLKFVDACCALVHAPLQNHLHPTTRPESASMFPGATAIDYRATESLR